MKKVQKTPKTYPRAVGIPKKNPLKETLINKKFTR